MEISAKERRILQQAKKIIERLLVKEASPVKKSTAREKINKYKNLIN